MKSMAFLKMNGAGNDFVVAADCDGNTVPRSAEAIRGFCDRRRGIGADGVIILKPLGGNRLKMEYFNADGSSAEMCGNGLRCAMEFAAELELVPGDHAVFLTGAGELEAWRLAPGLIRTAMPPAAPFRILTVCGYSCYLTSTGVHHAVVPLRKTELDEIEVDVLGRAIRFSDELAPEGANVDFIEMPDRDTIRIRTYERGVEAETLACGTGMAAAGAYAHRFLEPREKRRILSAGGDVLTVEIRGDGKNPGEIFLSGPAQTAFSGKMDLK